MKAINLAYMKITMSCVWRTPIPLSLHYNYTYCLNVALFSATQCWGVAYNKRASIQFCCGIQLSMRSTSSQSILEATLPEDTLDSSVDA